jgi:hypothetical protein
MLLGLIMIAVFIGMCVNEQTKRHCRKGNHVWKPYGPHRMECKHCHALTGIIPPSPTNVYEYPTTVRRYRPM